MFIPIALLFDLFDEDAKSVPAVVSHGVLAVMKKGKSAKAAWNIVRGNLSRHGYLKDPQRANAPFKSVKQTIKGSQRSMKHAMEKDAPRKFKEFQRAAAKMDPKTLR